MSDPESDTVQCEVADVEEKEDDSETENADKIRADSNETEDAATPVEVSQGMTYCSMHSHKRTCKRTNKAIEPCCLDPCRSSTKTDGFEPVR